MNVWLFQGVLAAAPLAFVFPSLCVLKLQNDKILSWQNLDKICLVIFGGSVCLCGTVMSIMGIVSGVSCSHGADMDYCRGMDGTALNHTTTTELAADSLQ